MSTCTDLINAINAVVVDPNLLASVDPSSIATLSNIGTTETVISLSGGGPAVLSAPASPSIDGVLLKLIVSGKVHYAQSCQFTPQVYLGSSATIGSDTALTSLNSGSASGDYNFIVQCYLLWDSVSEIVHGYSNYVPADTSGNLGSAGTSTITGISSQTGLQFVVSGRFNTANASNSVTLTQLTLSQT